MLGSIDPKDKSIISVERRVTMLGDGGEIEY